MNYSDLSIFEQALVLEQLPHDEFKKLCMTNKEISAICSGVGGNKFTQKLYQERSKNFFSRGVLSFKPTEMSWKEFYDRVYDFNLRLEKSKNHNYFIKELMREGKLMEMKLLKIITNIIPDGIEISNMLGTGRIKNKIEILKWLKDIGIIETNMMSAVLLGEYEVVKWMIEQGGMPDAGVLGNAVSQNRIDMLDLFASYGFFPDQWGSNKAKTSEMLNWLQNHQPNTVMPNQYAKYDRLNDGNIVILEWLYNHGVVFDQNDTYSLLNDQYKRHNGSNILKSLNWLESKGILPPRNYYSSLLPKELISWLKERNLNQNTNV